MAKWIWLKEGQIVDSHADFFIPLQSSSEKTVIKLSADSDYTLYVNGKFVSCNQYRDYPFYKIYDEIDITDYLINGENAIAIEVWYYGAPNWSYYTSNAGLWYELYQDGELVKESDEDTLSRLSPLYQHELKREISPQLGWAYHYIAASEDGWKTKLADGFEKSAPGGKGISQPIPRPIKRMEILPPAESTFIREANNRILYDLGRETVGFPTLRLTSPVSQKLRLMWGEHINDGQVREVVGNRKFYMDITVGEGVTEFSNYLRRFGCRYLEIEYETPVKVDYLTLFPCVYPVNKIPVDCGSERRNKIYDIAVRTIYMCMHDHYEDCCWREQAMYAGDARNQSLCGYYAFGEYIFPRAAIYLISMDSREDGLLNIVYPYKGDMYPMPSCIPIATNSFVQVVHEYCRHSHDYSLARDVFKKLTDVMQTFIDHMEDGLLPIFPEGVETGCWNFYEWAEGLSYGYADRPSTISPFDAALNCAFSIALGQMQDICDWIGVKADYKAKQDALNKKIYDTWYNKNTGWVQNRTDEEFYSEYVNGLAILCGAVKGKEAEHIAEALAGNKLSTTSLSWKCNKYDALLKVDKEKYRDYILNDIDTMYGHMVDAGATTFWETVIGSEDFSGAGSMCHGWSGMPIYYYHILGVAKKK